MLKNKLLDTSKKPSTDLLTCIWLVLSIVAVYYQVLFFEFVNYDTSEYVYDNAYVKKGLTLDNIIWAFSTTTLGNWHPITWLSHMVDVELFGLNSGAHHAVNVLFHIVNSLILYWIIKKLSGSLWSAWFIASLFALHPLHVQSVAWVAERKDVLSTMFGFFSIISYCYYVEKRESCYLLMIMFYLLSVLSKPMLVTLPCILLLIDYWPLNRLNKINQNNLEEPEPVLNIKIILTTHANLLIEKIPMFFFSAVSCIITLYAQHSGGAIASIASIPIYPRVFNAVISYAKYVVFMFYPINLAVIYPYPKVFSFYNILFSTLFIFGISFFSLWNIKKRPCVFVGWFFFIGTLVPVIGIIQVGEQAMADRYTYIPLIGLFIVISGSITGGLNYFQKYFNLKEELKENLRWFLAFFIILFFGVISWKQVQYWENSITLFSRALEVTVNNDVAHNNLGHAFILKNEYEKAEDQFINAIKINPTFWIAHLNYGNILANKNNRSEAMEHYRIAIKLNPYYVDAYIKLGNSYYHMGKYSDALKYYLSAYKLQPHNLGALNGIGALMVKSERIDKAIYFFKKALEIDPNDPSAKNNLQKTSQQK